MKESPLSIGTTLSPPLNTFIKINFTCYDNYELRVFTAAVPDVKQTSFPLINKYYLILHKYIAVCLILRQSLYLTSRHRSLTFIPPSLNLHPPFLTLRCYFFAFLTLRRIVPQKQRKGSFIRW